MNMISNRLKYTILNQLKLDDFDFSDNTTADQVPGWDSLTHINIIVAIEREFAIKFKGYEVLRLKNVGDLQRLINERMTE